MDEAGTFSIPHLTGETVMADRKSLGIIGHIMGGVTAVVIGIGIFVVRRNIIGYVLEAPFLAPSRRLPA
jgi:hypothetical protein